MWLDPERFRIIENHLGFYPWEGKIILDIGADWGSTPFYFLEHCRAKQVIAVEGDLELFTQLDVNARKYFEEKGLKTPEEKWYKLVLERLWISHPYHFAYLFCKYDFVDVVKIDIEGYEILLYDLPLEIISIPKEYVIEFHSTSIMERLKEKLQKNFEVTKASISNTLVAKNLQPVERVHI